MEDDETFPVDKQSKEIQIIEERHNAQKGTEITVISERQKNSEGEFSLDGLKTDINPDYYKIAGTDWFEDDDELVLTDPIVLRLKP